MQRSFAFIIIMLNIVAVGCAPTYVESLVTSQGSVIEINGARFEIPMNSVAEPTQVRIEKRGGARRTYEQGFGLLGESFVIQPETLVFEKPITFSYAAQWKNAGLGVKKGNGFVPLADAEVHGETLVATLWHGGEYCLIEKPEKYGIIDNVKANEGMLIVSDIYVSDYIRNFKRVLRKNGYDHPIWTFVYQTGESIEMNAQLLHEELKRLHEEYGEFRMDVVSFGIGGLATHRYATDTSYYLRDISPAMIAIGTPFFGSSFAFVESAKKGMSPYRFDFVDGMGVHARDLGEGSELIAKVRERRHLPGWHYYDDPAENKNFVSLRGKTSIVGDLPEEKSGDGLVSLISTMLTFIEPEPFNLNHYELFEDKKVHATTADFVMLYRSFSWPVIFLRVWKGQESIAQINEIWEREIRLHLRDDVDFDVLLEFNWNMLASAPSDAILITNGDYDTYPAWYLQERGVRRDVLIVNRGLLNLIEYARFLRRNGLPLEIGDDELGQLRHEETDGNIETISDQLLRMLLGQNKRPVVFSTTVYKPEQYGYPLKLLGLVYGISESNINVERTRHLLYETFRFEKLFSRPIDSVNTNLQSMAKNYAAVAFQLAMALDEAGEHNEAIKALEFARRFFKEPMFYYDEAKIYFKIGEREKAEQTLEELLKKEAGDMRLRREVARVYYENGLNEEAIRILAGILQERPGDKEILELIRKYQEE